METIIEEKKVKVTTYIATDGKKFKNREECENHEKELEEKKDPQYLLNQFIKNADVYLDKVYGGKKAYINKLRRMFDLLPVKERERFIDILYTMARAGYSYAREIYDEGRGR